MAGVRFSRQWVRRLWWSTAGAALVEASIVIPLFLIPLMAGLTEFGTFLYQHHQVVTGVRDAARWTARRTDPFSAANVTSAQNLATRGQVDGVAGDERVSGWVPTDVTVAPRNVANPAGPNQLRGPDPIVLVVVSTNWTYQDFGMLDFLQLGPITTTVSQEERHIGE